MDDRKPAIKSLSSIEVEGAHGNSGSRQLIFSQGDPFVSSKFEAMTKGFLPKGAIFDWHEHNGVDEFFLVTSGIGTIEYKDGTKFEYKSGDIIYSPANCPHKLTNTGCDDNVFYFIRIAE